MAQASLKDLKPNERKVLRALGRDYGDYGFYGFATIARRTKLNRKEVRRAARSLKRKGLADYCRGLFNEDGEVAGSGYGCTREGAEVLGMVA